MKPKVRHQKRGLGLVLMLLSILFFGAGLSRLSMGVAEALAADGNTTPPSPAVAQLETPSALFEALREREARADAREQDLQNRAQALEAAETRLRAQIAELQAAEARLKETLSLTETAAESDLARLTAVFEHMKPPQAAALFSTMDTEFAAGFIARLNPQFAGLVMAELDPTLAYGISAVLAGRHARTPRN